MTDDDTDKLLMAEVDRLDDLLVDVAEIERQARHFEALERRRQFFVIKGGKHGAPGR